MNEFDEITEKLMQDPRNASYTKRGVGPIYQLSNKAEILIIGQAPGRKVEESGVPFADKSGEKLREWMGGEWRRILFAEDCNFTDGFLLSR